MKKISFQSSRECPFEINGTRSLAEKMICSDFFVQYIHRKETKQTQPTERWQTIAKLCVFFLSFCLSLYLPLSLLLSVSNRRRWCSRAWSRRVGRRPARNAPARRASAAAASASAGARTATATSNRCSAAIIKIKDKQQTEPSRKGWRRSPPPPPPPPPPPSTSSFIRSKTSSSRDDGSNR